MNKKLTSGNVDRIDENILGAMPWLREQFLATGGESPDETAHELDKFFCLTQITDEPLAMVGGNVDKMWHRLVEFTEFYGDFCESRYGGFIHHRAKTATSPVPDEAVRNFYRIYEQNYGPVPQIWSVGTLQAIIDYGTGKINALPSVAKWSGWPGRQLTSEASRCSTQQGPRSLHHICGTDMNSRSILLTRSMENSLPTGEAASSPIIPRHQIMQIGDGLICEA